MVANMRSQYGDMVDPEAAVEHHLVGLSVRSYLEVILPRHVRVDVRFDRPVDDRRLFLAWWRRVIVVIGRRPLPLFHLDEIWRRRGHDPTLNEGHECASLGGPGAISRCKLISSSRTPDGAELTCLNR